MNEGRRDDEAAREDDDENANKIKKTPLYQSSSIIILSFKKTSGSRAEGSTAIRTLCNKIMTIQKNTKLLKKSQLAQGQSTLVFYCLLIIIIVVVLIAFIIQLFRCITMGIEVKKTFLKVVTDIMPMMVSQHRLKNYTSVWCLIRLSSYEKVQVGLKNAIELDIQDRRL